MSKTEEVQMKWFPPRIEHRKMRSIICTHQACGICSLIAASLLIPGCAAISVVSTPASAVSDNAPQHTPYTPEELARIAAMPAVPVFDAETAAKTTVAKVAAPILSGITETLSASAEKSAAADLKPETVAKPTTQLADVPKPVDPAPSRVAASNPSPSTSQPTDHKIATKTEPKPETTPQRTDVAMGGETKKSSTTGTETTLRNNSGSAPSAAQQPRVANSKPSGMVIKKPEAFAWKKSGQSSGNRPFQTIHVGDEGYRTLVLGSVGGNDPLAIELVERLARHLHEDSLILGGFECTIVRTINPDGEANRKLRNEKNEYVNSGFPKTLTDSSKSSMAEAKFVLEQINAIKPQRIVHIRSVEGGTGVVATGFSSQTAAREASEWLKFKMFMLPERSNAGTLERFVSTSGLADMITIGIPDTTPKDEVWPLFGDTVLNLLLAEDFASREVARKQ
jgi:hypothetical protein